MEGLGLPQKSFRGGASLGGMSASWPFARLAVSEEFLLLSAGWDSVEFLPPEVVELEPFVSIPWLAGGIRIVHNRADCPGRVVFFCFGSGAKLLQKITACGFLPCGQACVRAPGFALRWWVVIAFVLVWNALMLAGRPFAARQPMEGWGYMAAAFFLTFGFVLALLNSPRLQSKVLREGHHIGEIRPVLRFLLQLSGGLYVVLSIAWMIGSI